MALNGWTKKCLITLDTNDITANLTNFTVLLTATNLPSEILGATGGCNADGSDIRFATDTNGDTLLEYDLVHLDKTGGEIVVYVKADVVSSGSNTFYVFWGNASAQKPAYDVWDSYYGAIHFQEAPISNGFKTAKDSAGTYNDLSCAGLPTQVSAFVTGHKGWQITSNNYVVLEEEMNTAGDFYFEFWINYNGTAPTAGTQNLFAPVDYYSGVGTTGIGINFGSLTVRDVTIGGGQWANWNKWVHVAFYTDSGTMYYYVDGVLASSAAFTTQIERLKWLSGEGSGKPIQFPAVGYSIAGLKFTRASQIASASDVIKTRYNNVNNISTFATAGTVETTSVQTTLTLTGLIANSEVRVYDNTGTELAGVENSTTSFVYSYSYTADVDATIVVHSLEYEYLSLSLTLSNQSLTVPIQQRKDRNYSNP